MLIKICIDGDELQNRADHRKNVPNEVEILDFRKNVEGYTNGICKSACEDQKECSGIKCEELLDEDDCTPTHR